MIDLTSGEIAFLAALCESAASKARSELGMDALESASHITTLAHKLRRAQVASINTTAASDRPGLVYGAHGMPTATSLRDLAAWATRRLDGLSPAQADRLGARIAEVRDGADAIAGDVILTPEHRDRLVQAAVHSAQGLLSILGGR